MAEVGLLGQLAQVMSVLSSNQINAKALVGSL